MRKRKIKVCKFYSALLQFDRNITDRCLDIDITSISLRRELEDMRLFTTKKEFLSYLNKYDAILPKYLEHAPYAMFSSSKKAKTAAQKVLKNKKFYERFGNVRYIDIVIEEFIGFIDEDDPYYFFDLYNGNTYQYKIIKKRGERKLSLLKTKYNKGRINNEDKK
jgi:hypothetical protein